MDNETKEILTDNEKLRLLLEHEGWQVARNLLVNKILGLQNISSIELTTPEQMFIEIKANKLASEILFDFLKVDIEGTVEQHTNNSNLPTQQEGYIIRQ